MNWKSMILQALLSLIYLWTRCVTIFYTRLTVYCKKNTMYVVIFVLHSMGFNNYKIRILCLICISSNSAPVYKYRQRVFYSSFYKIYSAVKHLVLTFNFHSTALLTPCAAARSQYFLLEQFNWARSCYVKYVYDFAYYAFFYQAPIVKKGANASYKEILQ